MKCAGERYSFKVLRKTDIGYMLQDEEGNEYFLHKNQATHDLFEGEYVLAFLYFDGQKRITATMEEPSVTLSKPGWGIVKSVNPNLGIFLGINISKDILISKDMLPSDLSLWPKIGDHLYIHLKAKTNQLVAKIVGKTLLKTNPHAIDEGTLVKAYVSRIMTEGVSCYTEDLNVIFIHKTQMRANVRLGEELAVKIIKANPNGEYSGSLIQRKENQMNDDSAIILEYLVTNNGKMRFGNDSTPEEIYNNFNMSKKAFKRALGHLYKERKIDFVDGKTILVK